MVNAVSEILHGDPILPQDLVEEIQNLTEICAQTEPESGIDALGRRLNALHSEVRFKSVLTRGNWYRLGGVVDSEYRIVSRHIGAWVECEAGGDVDAIVSKYADKGWFATRVAGKTHYFTAPLGERAEDFLQLEIEELQEVLERPLIDPDNYPDSLEELIDPAEYRRVEALPVSKARYQFRFITPIGGFLNELPADKQANRNLRRFFEDWNRSTASEVRFCDHWVLGFRRYVDSDGESRASARPVFTYAGDLPEIARASDLGGADLAKAIHGYDRVLGYPFAWYFMMLASKAANFALADAVLRDQMGAFDYLPSRDLKVLKEWAERPYGV